MTITNDVKKQNINVQFEVTKIDQDKGHTTLKGYRILNSHIKRLVRRERSKIDDSFLARSKDNKIVRFKPLLISRTNAPRSVCTNIRIQAREVLREYSKTATVDQMFSDLFSGKIQRMMKEKLGKQFPLRVTDVRSLYIETKKKYAHLQKSKKVEAEPEKETKEVVPPVEKTEPTEQ